MVRPLHDVHRLADDPSRRGLAAGAAGHAHQASSDRRDGGLDLDPRSAGPSRSRLPVSGARASTPPPRLVLLGASNLTRAISTVVETARLLVGEPEEILVAAGHGRSYGLGSSVFGRFLPSILGCGLWSRLREGDPATPTYALVADAGNDIAYGQPPARILAWIDEVVDRLHAVDARVVLAGLPLDTLACMHPAWFACFRTLMFPGRELTREQAIVRARELHAGLESLARERGASFACLRPEWYGFDPIHIKLRHWRAAWSELLAAWARERTSAETATTRGRREGAAGSSAHPARARVATSTATRRRRGGTARGNGFMTSSPRAGSEPRGRGSREGGTGSGRPHILQSRPPPGLAAPGSALAGTRRWRRPASGLVRGGSAFAALGSPRPGSAPPPSVAGAREAPGADALERRARRQNHVVAVARTDDLEAHRQPLGARPRRHRGRGVTGVVEGIGEAPAEERVHGYHNAARGDYRFQALKELIAEGASEPAAAGSKIG